MEGVIARIAKDDAKAQAAFTAARADQEKLSKLNQTTGPALCVLDLDRRRSWAREKKHYGKAVARWSFLP